MTVLVSLSVAAILYVTRGNENCQARTAIHGVNEFFNEFLIRLECNLFIAEWKQGKALQCHAITCCRGSKELLCITEGQSVERTNLSIRMELL